MKKLFIILKDLSNLQRETLIFTFYPNQMFVLSNFLLKPEESQNSIYKLINNFSKLGLNRKVEALKSLLEPNKSFIKIPVI